MGMREGSDPLALSRGAAIRGSCFFRFFARTRRRGGASGFRPSRSLPWGCNSWLLLLWFLRTDSPPGDARGFRPSRALPRDCDSRLLTSFISSHELAAEDARGFRPSRALPWDWDSRLLLLSFLLTNSPPGEREGSVPLALSHGAAIRGSCFFCFFEQTRRRGMREGSDPLALSRGGRDSRLSTSFASPFVSPYSSGMRTVSDWGGTVTAVDSFLGCAESRFAERKSVWVTASGSVTRMSRSDERLYTR